MSEADAASLLHEVFDAGTRMISTASRRVADERFEFVDVGGGEAVHGREPVATVLQSAP